MLAAVLGRGLERKHARKQDEADLHEEVEAQVDVIVEVDADCLADVGQGAVQDDGHEDDADVQEVDAALDVKLLGLLTRCEQVGGAAALGSLLAHVVVVDESEDDAQDSRVEQEQRPDMLQGPEEGHAAQVAQEQGRIAQGREAAADVGNQEDEEDDDVRLVLAPGVGTQQRTDEQHGRTRGADPAGKQRAHQKQQDVVARGAGDEAFYGNAARDDEQAEKQHDERDIVEHDRLDQLIDELVRAMEDGKRDAEEQGPANGDKQLVLLVPSRNHQRHDGDGKQHARKGYDAP